MEIVEIWQNLEKKRNTDYDFPTRRLQIRRMFLFRLDGHERVRESLYAKGPTPASDHCTQSCWTTPSWNVSTVNGIWVQIIGIICGRKITVVWKLCVPHNRHSTISSSSILCQNCERGVGNIGNLKWLARRRGGRLSHTTKTKIICAPSA